MATRLRERDAEVVVVVVVTTVFEEACRAPNAVMRSTTTVENSVFLCKFTLSTDELCAKCVPA